MEKITTKSAYDIALERLELIFQAKEGTKESEEANILASAIEEYESVHFHIS